MILAADIGGTTARFRLVAAERGPGPVVGDAAHPVAAHPAFDDALACFLAECGGAGMRIDAACLAVAGPVCGGRARLTNAPWVVDAAAVAERFAIGRVRLVNDLEAAAAGIDCLPPGALETLQAGQPLEPRHRVVIGAGTGLGVAYSIVGSGGARITVAGEGGHAGFAPAHALHAELWRFLEGRFGHVTAEHVVSGPGLVRVYEFLRSRERGTADALPADVDANGAAAVVKRAAAGGDPAARQAAELVVECLAAAAGDHALAVLAHGGVFLAGGMAPRLLPWMRGGRFVSVWREKGVHAPLMMRFPVHVVLDEGVGLRGATALAAAAAG